MEYVQNFVVGGSIFRAQTNVFETQLRENVYAVLCLSKMFRSSINRLCPCPVKSIKF